MNKPRYPYAYLRVELAARIDEDMTQEEIAKEFNVCKDTVNEWCRKLGFERRVRGSRQHRYKGYDNRARIMKYIQEGFNQTQIAGFMGLTQSRICHYIGYLIQSGFLRRIGYGKYVVTREWLDTKDDDDAE